MARALLVDDEKYIRNGIRAIISRSDSIFTEIDECINGIEALQKLSQYEYDLVITDLIMPQIDGIELVSRIDCMEHRPYTVVLSGYDDFKYAQKAITYGVKAYLLKPVNRTEVMAIVKKAETEYLKKQKTEPKADERKNNEYHANQFKLMLLSDNTSIDETNSFFSSCGMEFACEKYHVAMLNSDEIYSYQDKRESNLALVSNIKKIISESNTFGYCFLDNSDNVVSILNTKSDIARIAEYINRMYGSRCTVGIGGTFQDAAGMKLSYSQSEYALKYKLLVHDRNVISYSEIASREHNFVLPVRLVKNLTGMLDTERKDQLNELVNKIFDDNAVHKYQLEYLEKLSELLKNEIIEYLSEIIPHRLEFIKEQEAGFKSIYEFIDLRNFTRFVKNFIMNINEVLLKFKNICNTDKTIEMAVKYVQENYRSDLTMAEVANHISLNYSYFSILFKEKTGMNFVDYLRLIRIEKAKELLQNSIYKIYEVSEMVGYNNTKHFATTFRALTGISPKEYREKLYIN